MSFKCLYCYETCISLSDELYIPSLKKQLQFKSQVVPTLEPYVINPRFGTNTLNNLQGHSLHIHCFTSLLHKKQFSFFLTETLANF